MTLLTIVQGAQRKLRLPVSNVVTSATDKNVLTLWELANEEGESLYRHHPWQQLKSEHTWTSTATEAQTDAIPDDFGRIIPDTMFNRTENRKVIGPLSSKEWQQQKSLVTNFLIDAWHIRGDSLLVTPTPDAGETYAYEYVSRHWCRSSDGTAKAAFTADTDTVPLPERLFILGLDWRFRADRALEYEKQLDAYRKALTEETTFDGGRRMVDMTGGHRSYIGTAIAPEGSWSL